MDNMTAEQALDAVHELLADPDGIADNGDLMYKLKQVEAFVAETVRSQALSAPRVPEDVKWPSFEEFCRNLAIGGDGMGTAERYGAEQAWMYLRNHFTNAQLPTAPEARSESEIQAEALEAFRHGPLRDLCLACGWDTGTSAYQVANLLESEAARLREGGEL